MGEAQRGWIVSYFARVGHGDVVGGVVFLDERRGARQDGRLWPRVLEVQVVGHAGGAAGARSVEVFVGGRGEVPDLLLLDPVQGRSEWDCIPPLLSARRGWP